MALRVAIVGAGMAGATCAADLTSAGVVTRVFDKSRGPGGRMSSRRAPTGHRFDHGVARFAATSPAFRAALAPAIDAGVLRPVVGARDDDYVATNGMSGLCKHLLAGIDVACSTRIVGVGRAASWTLTDESGRTHGPFDAVVVAIPPAQAADLIASVAPAAAVRLRGVAMIPRWTGLFGFDAPLDAPSAEIDHPDARLDRSAANEVGDAWVAQASDAWSIRNLELPADEAVERLAAIARQSLGEAWREPTFRTAHRWRYAYVDTPLGEAFIEPVTGLAVCGDWCLGPTVEAAWQSGQAVAMHLRNRADVFYAPPHS